MNRATKAAVIAAALPLVAVPLSLGAVSTARAADLLPDGAATVLTHGPTASAIDDYVQGSLCEAPKICREAPYFAMLNFFPGLEIGLSGNVAILEQAIDDTPGTKILFAYSGGARVAAGWLEAHADDLDAPSPEELSLVLIGNGTRAFGGGSAWLYGQATATPETQYKVLDISRQYDPVSDWPDNPFNLLALANAIAAFMSIHLDYTEVNINDPANTVWTEANTTYVLVPTENLPLLEPLRVLGLGALADALNQPLKALVEQGYNRDYPTTAQSDVTSAHSDSATFSSVVSDPAVASPEAMMPVSLAPAPEPPAGPAPTITPLEQAEGDGLAVADTATTPPPPDSDDVLQGAPQDVMEPLRTDPAPQSEEGSVPLTTEPEQGADDDNGGTAVAATTTTPSSDRADGANTVNSTTPRVNHRKPLTGTTRTRNSTTAPTTQTTTTSTDARNSAVTGKPGGNQITTTRENRATSTNEGSKAASSNGQPSAQGG